MADTWHDKEPVGEGLSPAPRAHGALGRRSGPCGHGLCRRPSAARARPRPRRSSRGRRVQRGCVQRCRHGNSNSQDFHESRDVTRNRKLGVAPGQRWPDPAPGCQASFSPERRLRPLPISGQRCPSLLRAAGRPRELRAPGCLVPALSRGLAGGRVPVDCADLSAGWGTHLHPLAPSHILPGSRTSTSVFGEMHRIKTF